MFARNVVENVLHNSRYGGSRAARWGHCWPARFEHCSPFSVERAIAEVASETAPVTAEPTAELQAVVRVRRKARGILQEMVANISPAFIR